MTSLCSAACLPRVLDQPGPLSKHFAGNLRSRCVKALNKDANFFFPVSASAFAWTCVPNSRYEKATY